MNEEQLLIDGGAEKRNAATGDLNNAQLAKEKEEQAWK